MHGNCFANTTSFYVKQQFDEWIFIMTANENGDYK